MDELGDLDAASEAQRREVAALPLAERLRLLDALCRDVGFIADRAARVG